MAFLPLKCRLLATDKNLRSACLDKATAPTGQENWCIESSERAGRKATGLGSSVPEYGSRANGRT